MRRHLQLIFRIGLYICAMFAPIAEGTERDLQDNHVTKPTDLIGSFTMNEVTFDNMDPPWMRNMNSGMIHLEDFPTTTFKKISLSFSSATVGEILDAVTKADGHYSWSYEGTVFVFYPREKNRKTSLDIVQVLNQKIPRFEARDVPVPDAAAMLMEQALAQGLKGLAVPARPSSLARVEEIIGPPGSNWHRRRPATFSVEQDTFSFSMRDRTIRECLNAIVAADPPSTWMAYRSIIIPTPHGWKTIPKPGKVVVSMPRGHSYREVPLRTYTDADVAAYLKIAHRAMELQHLKEAKGGLTPQEEAEFQKAEDYMRELKKKLPRSEDFIPPESTSH